MGWRGGGGESSNLRGGAQGKPPEKAVFELRTRGRRVTVSQGERSREEAPSIHSFIHLLIQPFSESLLKTCPASSTRLSDNSQQ